MKFYPSDEQEMVQESVRRAAAGLALRRRVMLEAGGGFDMESWGAMMAVGLGGLMLPEEHGGSGLGLVEAALALEAVGEEAVPGAFAGHLVAGIALRACYVVSLRRRWLPQMASGDVSAASILRADGAERPDWPRATAGKVSGQVPIAVAAAGSALIVLETADGEVGLVEVDDGRVELTPVEGSDPTRPMVSVRFADADFVSLGLDRAASDRLLDAALVMIAADALGGAERCLALALDHAKTREQFERPIGAFQAVKHQLADMALAVEPARALLWYAALAWDRGLPDARRAAAQAKAHLADRFVEVARAAVEIHGGIGYTWEHDLHVGFRRSLHDHAYLGAPSLHRERAAVLAGW